MVFQRLKPQSSERSPPPAPTPPGASDPNALINGRYRIESRLAEGGMGCVYCVRDERTGSQLALKRLLHGDSKQHVALFEREYRTLVGIEHPRIIRAFDYGVDAEGPFYTMELAVGQDLHKLAPLPVQTALSYLRDIATCLGLLHTRRLLHRDITPHNVRVLENGECKLIDFGALTSFGIPELIVGTPPCIPPEALQRAPIDQRADIFSFGALMYWSLTRKHAYPARNISELTSVWKKRPAPPSSLVPGISKQLDAFILRLLHIDPQLRPASMAEVVDRLTALGQLPQEDAATQHALAESYLVHTGCVGREPELRRLRDLANQLRGGRGHAALLLGPRGVGRSRMLHELSLQAQLLGLTTLQLHTRARPEPYGGVIALLEHVIESVPAARQVALTHSATLAQLGSSIASRLGVAAAAPHAEISGDWRVRTQQLILDLVSTACLAQPLLILVDDVDAADEASLAMFAGLAGLTAQTQLTLIATATALSNQPESPVALSWRSLQKRSEKIELTPLSSRDVTTLARSLFGDVQHLQRFSEWLNEHAGGLPLHVMALVRKLHARGVIRYLDGIWVLPPERPSELVVDDLSALLASRIENLSPSARALAEAIAADSGALTREGCARLVGNDNPLLLLDELVRAEVLEDSLAGYRFTHHVLRGVLLQQMPPERRSKLHEESAERALAGATAATLTSARMQAGWQLLQAGQEERGADLLATVAYDAVGVRLAFADLQVMAPALEAALNVYTKLGRSLHERMPLMTALAQAGYYVDRAWGERYGDAALAAVQELSGLRVSARLRRYLGRTPSLIVGLIVGFVRFKMLKGRVPYRFFDVLTQMFGVVTTLSGAAAIALDVPRATRVAAVLEPFLGLPRQLTPTGIAEYCASLREIGRENQAFALSVWLKLLARFQDRRYYTALPKPTRPLYTGGLLFARGVFESFRDGEGALESADALDRLGLKLYSMVASALRSIHFANRGDLVQARLHREQVDVHAVQVGSAWQVELWEPAALILVYTQLGDVTEMMRVSDRLDAAAKRYSSLALYARLSRLALSLTRLDDGGLQHEAGPHVLLDSMIEGVQAVLEAEPPRSFIGWGAVCGFGARALNYVGRHAEAKALCERALSQLTAADRPFVTLFLNIELELVAAEAGLGAFSEARARLDEIRSFHAASENPLTRGRIHEAHARLAARAEDWPSFREHLDAMRSWYSRTAAASLVARAERLRSLDPVPSNRPGSSAVAGSDASPPVDAARGLSEAANENARPSERTVCTVTDVTHDDAATRLRHRAKP